MHRTALSSLLMAAAAVALPTAHAGTPASQSVHVTGVAPPMPDAATMSAMTGDFRLSDGRALRVMRPGWHLMVAVGRGWAVTVEPVGERQFASRDGRIMVTFDADLDGLRLIEQQRLTVAARTGDAAPLR